MIELFETAVAVGRAAFAFIKGLLSTLKASPAITVAVFKSVAAAVGEEGGLAGLAVKAVDGAGGLSGAEKKSIEEAVVKVKDVLQRVESETEEGIAVAGKKGGEVKSNGTGYLGEAAGTWNDVTKVQDYIANGVHHIEIVTNADPKKYIITNLENGILDIDIAAGKGSTVRGRRLLEMAIEQYGGIGNIRGMESHYVGSNIDAINEAIGIDKMSLEKAIQERTTISICTKMC